MLTAVRFVQNFPVCGCRLHVVPEPVDVEFFNPAGVTPLDLPIGQLVFGNARSKTKPVAFLSVSSLCLFWYQHCMLLQAFDYRFVGFITCPVTQAQFQVAPFLASNALCLSALSVPLSSSGCFLHNSVCMTNM